MPNTVKDARRLQGELAYHLSLVKGSLAYIINEETKGRRLGFAYGYGEKIAHHIDRIHFMLSELSVIPGLNEDVLFEAMRVSSVLTAATHFIVYSFEAIKGSEGSEDSREKFNVAFDSEEFVTNMKEIDQQLIRVGELLSKLELI